ncbi:putative serine/threonine-protein kinase/receptor [Acanthamoeba polyphaga mimivirus]|nr:putative serine/threonine-protein kinase/receptor [Mimivirus reunion]WMV62216.1 putative serine/threonine-protein kinase/receptor [Mimivirus sp.]WMV63193.1 putative serine/threonine-protein kinase/receptor [Acanthamoeba polyphaga mimivirus]WMV64170.1 putative serine/threonine-protein kinase/receptor [Mimivirus sp.]
MHSVYTKYTIILILLVIYQGLPTNTQVASRIFGVGSKSSGPLYRQLIDIYSYTYDNAVFIFEDLPIDVILTQVDYIDYVGLDRCISHEYEEIFNLVQFPLAGQAIVMTYNVPELANLDTRIVIDRQTLGKIWTGEISKWNHPDIIALNPTLNGTLPDKEIKLGYNDDGNVSISGIVQAALSSFYGNFATEFNNAGQLFANMSFANEPRCVNIGPSSRERFDWVKNTTYSLTFVNYADVFNNTNPNISVMNMYNKAGNLVEPSLESVQFAMADFKDEYSNNNFALDVFDAPGNNSWPLSYVNYIVMSKRFFQLDCSRADVVLKFIAWVYTNTAASKALTQNQFYPLDNTLKKVSIDNIYIVKCNNVSVSEQQYLISFGGSTSIVPSWLTAFTSGSIVAKYYSTLSSNSIELLTTHGCDFAVTINGVDQKFYQEIEDLAVMPLAAFSIVPAYNIPEIVGKTLVLDIDVIVKIYLGEITNWNDTKIRNLNPEISNYLPNAIINVVVQNIESDINQIFTKFLSQESEIFSQEIGQTYNPDLSLFNSSVIFVDDIDGLGDELIDNKYSFGFWTDFGVRLLSRVQTVQMASLKINDDIIEPNYDTLKNAISSESNQIARSTNSNVWPITSMISIVYPETTMKNKDKAVAIAEFMYWTQYDPLAINSANNKGYYLASSDPQLRSVVLDLLKNFKFEDESVSSYANCIYQGSICSNFGTCIESACICNSSRTGTYCEKIITDSENNTLIIILATVIPIACIFGLLLLTLLIVIIFLLKHRNTTNNDWEIDFSELEIGETLGTGGYGEVYKSIWKGTEVAVKLISSKHVSKDMERSFFEEVKIMTSLRHPNVVLFMAASTKSPNMCIVMEFMSLGSLYDLLGNELIPEIPYALKIKMAYQASKGMHFLHSSGIVHRDLKSLNLLLDSKWNVKVSDFGLTKVKSELDKKKTNDNIIGTIHWIAPEILNDSTEVDYILADVYSFGIILWELLTREQPYKGMTPAAIAVSVIRDGMRPPISDEAVTAHSIEYIDLIKQCWHSDTIIRPTFLEIMTRLSNILGDSSNMTSGTSSSSLSSGGIGKSITDSKSSNSRSSVESSNTSNTFRGIDRHNSHPTGEVTVAFIDIISASKLWEYDPDGMCESTKMYNEIIRRVTKKYGGYESFISKDRNSGEGSFCLVFSDAIQAINSCEEMQLQLLNANWPKKILQHPAAAEEFDRTDQLIFRGLRVRMALHCGSVKISQDPMTRKYQYSGSTVNITGKITTLTHGGQIIVSENLYQKVNSDFTFITVGKIDIPDYPSKMTLYEIKFEILKNRFFGGITYVNYNDDTDSGTADDSNYDSGKIIDIDYMADIDKEDSFLTSANMCRWIINYDEISIGKQIGLGSYGIVFNGKWKGVDVAVKKFVKQKLSETQLLEFRAEMAFLSELKHSNIVTFIGACIKKPNICIVTEYMRMGNLRDVLKNPDIKITFANKLKLLYGAAMGIDYLHSSNPMIVHRDIKPANILVDEHFNVKIADFGFARIKEDNTTMTRCGTPCWTAPEVIRGEKYCEKADVFSFGVVMWEVLTGKEPFVECNFMKVSLDILEGGRPIIPSDCPHEFAKLIKKCWHAKAHKRPTMTEVVQQLMLITEQFDHKV